jgi:hypothetical protein
MAFIDSVQRCEQKGIKEQPCFNKWHDKIRRQRNEVLPPPPPPNDTDNTRHTEITHVRLQSVTVQVMPMDDFPSGYYYFHEFWKVCFLPFHCITTSNAD